jgi:hypothetical protein
MTKAISWKVAFTGFLLGAMIVLAVWFSPLMPSMNQAQAQENFPPAFGTRWCSENHSTFYTQNREYKWVWVRHYTGEVAHKHVWGKYRRTASGNYNWVDRWNGDCYYVQIT